MKVSHITLKITGSANSGELLVTVPGRRRAYIMQVSIIFFFLALGQKEHATLPVIVENVLGADAYINPLPHALMLTAIVVSLGTTGVALALLMKIKEIYGTIEEEEITGKGWRK